MARTNAALARSHPDLANDPVWLSVVNAPVDPNPPSEAELAALADPDSLVFDGVDASAELRRQAASERRSRR